MGKDSVTREFGSFFNALVVVPWSKESFEISSVLNYYSFPVNYEEDLRGQHRKDWGFDKNDDYPMLVIDSSEVGIPSCELSGFEQITTWLFNNKLIGPAKSYSAYERQGLAFVEQTFEPALDDIYRLFIPMLQFYAQPKCFAETNILYDRHRGWFLSQFFKYLKGLRLWIAERGNHVNKDRLDKFKAFQ